MGSVRLCVLVWPLLLMLLVKTTPSVTVRDCPVLVTGVHQPRTPARPLHWRTVAPSRQHQLGRPPPGRGRAVFSVMSAGGGLHVHLFSAHLPAGYIIRVDADRWLVQRTFVGVRRKLAAGPGGGAPVLAAGRWTSYQLTVSGAEQIELLRLYDNGTASRLLRLSDPAPLPVDMLSLEVPGDVAANAADDGDVSPWTFWTFDCEPHLQPRETLCHIWPSWERVVSRRLRLVSARINPATGVSLHVQTEHTADVLLYETTSRYYRVSLTNSRLTLSRVQWGANTEVASACVPAAPRSRFRLVWVSILGGLIQVGLDDPAGTSSTCGDEDTAAAPTATPAPGAGETGVSTGQLAAAAEQTTVSTPPAAAQTEGLLAPEREQTGSWSVASAEPRADRERRQYPPLRTPLLNWTDAQPLYVLSYGFTTRGGIGLWTVDCLPDSDESADIDERLSTDSPMSDRDRFSSERGKNATPPIHTDPDGGSRRGADPPRFLTALVVLSVVSVLLLLATAVLVSGVISRWRQRAMFTPPPRRASLLGADQLDDAANQYGDLHLYEDMRPMCAQPGQSSFKPVRRQDTPVVGRAGSVADLPPPPDDI